MRSDSIVGAVLAGGKAVRMGGAKAAAVVGGVSLRDRALAVLDLVFEDVVLSVADAEQGITGRRVVIDRLPDLGPLAALESLLVAASGRGVFVLACDLPLVDEEIVRRILSSSAAGGSEDSVPAAGSKPGAWVASSNGRVQPLCGLYTASCLATVRRQLDAGRLSMRELLAVVEPDEVCLDDLGSDRLLNVNEPADLALARRAVDV